PGVRRQQVVELGAERVVLLSLLPPALELVKGRNERLGDVAAAVAAEVAHRASSTNARTLSWSLIPAADARCDAASTARGSPVRIPSPTWCGPTPPASTRRSSL